MSTRKATLMGDRGGLRGWLSKKGDRKVGGFTAGGWKKRYFVQQGSKLSYFENETETTEVGFIDLGRGYSCSAILDDKTNTTFQICTDDRRWVLKAPSEGDVSYWVKGVKSALKQHSKVAQLDLLEDSDSPVRLPEKLERQRSVSLGSGVEMQKEVLEVTTATGDEDLQSHASSGDDDRPPLPSGPLPERRGRGRGGPRGRGGRGRGAKHSHGTRLQPDLVQSAPHLKTMMDTDGTKSPPRSGLSGGEGPFTTPGRTSESESPLRRPLPDTGGDRGRANRPRGRGRGRGGCGRGGSFVSDEEKRKRADSFEAQREKPIPPTPTSPLNGGDRRMGTSPLRELPSSPESPGSDNEKKKPAMERPARSIPTVPKSAELKSDDDRSSSEIEEISGLNSSCDGMEEDNGDNLCHDGETEEDADHLRAPVVKLRQKQSSTSGTSAEATLRGSAKKNRTGTLRSIKGLKGKLATKPAGKDVIVNRSEKGTSLSVAAEESERSVVRGPVSPRNAPPRPAVPPGAPSEDPLTSNPPEEEFSHRTKIVKEILCTESSYCSSLSLIINKYKRLLEDKAAHDKHISEKTIATIFSNVEQIFEFNLHLLKEVETRVMEWDDETQLLGDVFVKMGQFLKMYTVYGSNYQNAITTYQKEVAENKTFAAALKVCDAATNNENIRLHHLLIMPVQRVPRYTLLLTDLEKHTPDDHPDKSNLKTALASMKTITSHLNENVRRQERDTQLAKLSKKGIPYEALLAPHRCLLRADTMSTSKGSHRYILLFNDILVQVPKSKLKKVKTEEVTNPDHNWPLHLTWLRRVSSSSSPSASISSLSSAAAIENGVDGANSSHLYEIIGPSGSIVVTFGENKEEAQKAAVENTRDMAIASPGSDGDEDARFGEFTYSNGNRYKGWWLLGQKHGNGDYQFCMNMYEGTFEHDKISGSGTMLFSTGEKYDGQWENNSPHGQGILQCPNNDKYVGSWDRGRKSGEGALFYGNGDQYSGGWKDDMPHGLGKMAYKSNETVTDQFVGQTYTGTYARGVRSGEGKLEYGNGVSYEGDWVDGAQHGRGVFTTADGTYYDGEWSGGLREGRGMMLYSDGRKYTGHWKANKRHGAGTFSSTKGKIRLYDGEWYHDAMHGKGRLELDNGDMYEGGFSRNRMHGEGVYTRGNGSVLKGKWNNGFREGKFDIYDQDMKLTGTCQENGSISLTPNSFGHLSYAIAPELPYLDSEFCYSW